jgi:Plant specific mitochondrial import receptor subunit TOM20
MVFISLWHCTRASALCTAQLGLAPACSPRHSSLTTMVLLDAAASHLSRLQQCFKEAVDEQPDNPVYKKGLEMTSKAPDLYDEIQKQMNPPTAIKRSGSSFWWDVAGWVTVLAGILAVSAMVGAANQARQNADKAAASK